MTYCPRQLHICLNVVCFRQKRVRSKGMCFVSRTMLFGNNLFTYNFFFFVYLSEDSVTGATQYIRDNSLQDGDTKVSLGLVRPL